MTLVFVHLYIVWLVLPDYSVVWHICTPPHYDDPSVTVLLVSTDQLSGPIVLCSSCVRCVYILYTVVPCYIVRSLYMNCVHVVHCVHMKVIIIIIVLKYCWYSHAHVCVNMHLIHMKPKWKIQSE